MVLYVCFMMFMYLFYLFLMVVNMELVWFGRLDLWMMCMVLVMVVDIELLVLEGVMEKVISMLLYYF